MDNNHNPRFLTYQRETLELRLKDQFSRLRNAPRYTETIGIIVTILVALAATDFKPALGLNASNWQLLANLTLGGLILKLLYDLYQQKTHGYSAEQFIEDLCTSSETEEKRRVLFFAKAQDDIGVERILVSFNHNHQCYLLPYMELKDMGNGSDNVIAKYISQSLSLADGTATVSHIEGAVAESFKRSESSPNDSVFYSFAFYAVVFAESAPNHIFAPEFEIQRTRYAWLTVDELMNDPASFNRNQEVLEHIKSNYERFFTDNTPTSLKRRLASDAS